jgi:putative DNA primase/helicase
MDKVKIAVGESRFTKKWRNEEMPIADFVARLKDTRRTTETLSEFRKLPKTEADNIKDIGGFVGGHLKNGSRKAGSCLIRSLVTLDADHCDPGDVDLIQNALEHYKIHYVIYSTHKHTPEHPRLRIVIFLSYDVTPDAFEAISRKIADNINIDIFDPTTFQPERLMYWPSTSSDGEFYFFESAYTDDLNPDAVLGEYEDWTDVSSWPMPHGETKKVQTGKEKMEDPLTKKGIIGLFNRAYPILDAINTFLPDVYEPSEIEDRYSYIPADSTKGLKVYLKDNLVHSFHASDPAAGKSLNAFDLVRIHKFGYLDEGTKEGTNVGKLPSSKAMADFAASLDAVKDLKMKELQQELEELDQPEDDWMDKLEYSPRNPDTLTKNAKNARLIFINDPKLQNFAFNELAGTVEVLGDVPWSRPSSNPFWRDADTDLLKEYIDLRYGILPDRAFNIGFSAITQDRRFHPVKDYFASLPKWDGTKRVETLLCDYLGAEDNEYVRAVTRKTLVAAVSRIYQPGIKFDYVLILDGKQGIGKGTLFSKLGGQWFTDSLSINDMKDKTGPEKLQGKWILELSEMAGMKKVELETVKSFISRTDDYYRPAFGHVVESHPRQSILVGSTNAEFGYLHDLTGNRRFWPVHVDGSSKKHSWDLDEETVKQIWAEAIVYYQEGEKLFLEGEIAEMAENQQTAAIEMDERTGLVEKYLEMLLPENWNKMNPVERYNYFDSLEGDSLVLRQPGVTRRMTVSYIEIWCECFGKDQANLERRDRNSISTIMAKIPGWERTNKLKGTIYGKQRVYERVPEED